MDTRNIRAALEQQLQGASGPWEQLPVLIELSRESACWDPDQTYRRAMQALHIARELGDLFWTAQSMWAVGLNLVRTTRYSEALFHLRQASRLFERMSQPLLKAQTDLAVADTCIAAGKFTEAMELLVKSLPLFERMEESRGIVQALCSFGDIYQGLGEHGKGIGYYRRAIGLATKKKMESELGTLHQHLADAYRQLGDAGRHHTYLLKSLALHRKNNSPDGIAAVMGSIAVMYIDRGCYGRAEKYVRQSATIYRRMGRTVLEAQGWGWLGKIFACRGNFAQALQCCRIGLALAAGSEDKTIVGTLYAQYGDTYRMAGQARRSLPYLEKGLSIISESGYRFHIYEVHRNLALSFEAVGATEKALTHYKEYNRIKEEYLGGRKYLEVSRMEMQRQQYRLQRHLQEERSRNVSLKKEVEEKEATLLSLTLELVRAEEQKKDGTQRNADDMLSGNWEVFARQFHQVHHGFYGKLMRHYPELSLTEIKVCSLIRIGLTSKEIASILCVSKRTVDCHRERIHKKLRLSSRALLANFIESM